MWRQREAGTVAELRYDALMKRPPEDCVWDPCLRAHDVVSGMQYRRGTSLL